MRSFRVKIALWSTVLSGAVLAAFAVVGLELIDQVGRNRVDRELLAIAQGFMRPRFEPGRGIESSLHFVYGEDLPVVLRVWGRDGEEIYRTPDFPRVLDGVEAGELGRPADPALVPDWGAAGGPRRPRPGDAGRPPPRRREGPPGRREGPPARPRHEPPPGALLPPFREGFPPGEGDERAERPPPPMRPPLFGTAQADGRSWRYAVVGHERSTVVVGLDLDPLLAERRTFRNAALVGMPLALLALAAGGFWLAQRALRPVALITERAARIQASGLDERIPAVASDRELAELVAVINGMLERLQRSFQQAARFGADAAHELKTPLTILQGQLEQAVQDAEEGSAAQRTFADLLVEVQRLRTITRKLLLLAQADAGRKLGGGEPVDFGAMVAELADDLRELAPALRIEVRGPAELTVRGDADLLRQLVQNLGINAVKFNRPGADGQGAIEFRLARASSGAVTLQVANTGPVLAADVRERLFERFYRGDAAHSRNVDGTGLGLSLAREIARGHGGELTLGPERPGWVSMTLRLPAV